jgi:vancomycin resistance protein YoaR
VTNTDQSSTNTKIFDADNMNSHGLSFEEIDIRDEIEVNHNPESHFVEVDHRVRNISFLFLLLLLVLSLIVYSEQFAYSSKILPSINIGNNNFGSQSKSDAKKNLDKEIKKALDTAITVNMEGKSISISPQDIGLKYDSQKSVDLAYEKAKSFSPTGATSSFFMRHFSTVKVDPIYTVDKKAFETVAQNVSSELSTGRTDAGITIDGLNVNVQKAVSGTGVSASEIKNELNASIKSFNTKKIDLKKKKVDAQITLNEANAKAKIVKQIFAENTVVTTPAGNTITITPQQISSALTVVASGAKLNINIDEALLRTAIASELSAAEIAPVDATFAVNGSTVSVVPSVAGKKVDLESTIKLIVKGQHTISAKVIENNPKHDTAWANSLNIRELVSTYTTNFPAGQERVKNITRAAQQVQDTVIEPNEIFSLNNKLGKRTAENGYVKAPVFSSNDGFFEDFGGGASQFTTTMFNAIWFGGYKDIEHAPHSIYISRYPMGREATLNWGSIDLKFQNDSKSGILVKTYVGPTSVTVSFYGDKEGRTVKSEGPNIISQTEIAKEYTDDPTLEVGKEKETEHGYKGMVVENFRIISRPGQEDKRERYRWTYIMVPAKVLRGTKPVTP